MDRLTLGNPSGGILLATGGIDSTVIAYALTKKKIPFAMLFFNYGQGAAEWEWEMVRIHGEKLEKETLRIDWTPPFVPSSSTDIFTGKRKPVLKYKERKDLGKMFGWIGGRNIIFCVYAGMLAEERGWGQVYFGAGLEDMHKDRDIGLAFFIHLNEALSLSFIHPMRVINPLDHLTGREIVELGKKLGVDWDLTTSCDRAFPPCNVCHNCGVREERLEE